MNKYIFLMLLSVVSISVIQADKNNLPGIEAVNSEFICTVNSHQKGVIGKLLKTMSDNPVWKLFFIEKKVKNLGRELRPVSSTQFLAYVSKHSHLRKYMNNISNSPKKWSSLTRSTVKGLKRQAADNLLDEIEDFAKYTNTDVDLLIEFANKGQWDQFIRYSVGCSY